ncbi:zinc finger protein Xfin-like isoform X2 [Athalia rosae]|nr:zinc finger protein Xfin-like isoform X2 [Athalia rosae]
MYNLENFYDFRTACVNAVAMLERFLPSNNRDTGDGIQRHSVQFTQLHSEPFKKKENMPILIPEAPIVNPNGALGTPPRLNSDGEAYHEIEEILHQVVSDDGGEYHDDQKSDEYEMDMETNPSDFLEMTSIVTEDAEETDAPNQGGTHNESEIFQHTSEQHEVYVCSLCNKAFSSKGHLSLHARIHVGAGDIVGEKVITDDHTSYKRPYQCDLCNKSYSTAKHRWGHVSTTHRGHPAVTCRYCSRIYSTRTNLEEHIKSRHAGLPPPPELSLPYIQQDNKFQCKTCPKMYTNVTDLNKHSRVCAGDRKKELSKKISVHKSKSVIDTSDLSSVDSDDEGKDYRDAEAKLANNPQLTILKQALTKKESLKREHDEPRVNQKPKKISRTVSSDMETQKRWYCETCPESFVSVDSLKEHELLHDADKPFICILCEKDFALKSSLSRHIVASHGVDPTPIIDSDKCLKRPPAPQVLNKQPNRVVNESHIEISDSSLSPQRNAENDFEHDSSPENMIEIETVFVCEICTRDFNDRASLWLHIRATHKEYAAFACGVCLKICADNTQLLNHVNMYHGGSKLQVSEQRRYSCTICGRQHDSRKKLITHVSIHNVDPGYDPASFVQLNSNYYSENYNSNEANDQTLEVDADEGEKMDCYICYKSFPSEDHLIRHQRNAHKSEPLAPMGESAGNGSGTGSVSGNGNRAQYHLFFVCELCGSSHPSKWERWLHVSSIHSNEPAIRCDRDTCGKIFATRSLRNDHVQHHTAQGASPNTCEICGKLWGSRVDYWKHVMGVHSDTVPLICGVCLKVFPDVIQLSGHVKAKHWPLTNGDFSCDICGRPYSNKSKMSRHRKIHGLEADNYINNSVNETLNDLRRLEYSVPDSDLNCELCANLKFANLEELCNHRRNVHSLFPCDLCNKCYGRTSHLWKHVNRVHKGHEDVTCCYCLKTSASREHLAAHIAKIHRYEPETKKEIRESLNSKSPNEEDETPHHCEKCNKGFHKRYLLRRHMKGCQNYRKDPGALLTRCRACERIFKDRASLQKHLENHHSTYTCHLCNEDVTSKLGIMTHNRVHHMNHPDLTCDHANCKKLFRTREDLESHIKDHKYHSVPNVCDFCGDTVENKLKLKMHILSLHRNEIGVSCGVCLIPMKDPKDLKKHVEEVHNHILSKPNTCQVCGKRYASKWKAFDHTKKCHGKVFRTCKQCLAVFTEDEELRNHYADVHNVPKDQLSAFNYRLEVSSGKQDEYEPTDLLIKEEPDDLDFVEDGCDEDVSRPQRKRSAADTFDCESCHEIFLNNDTLFQHYRNVHNINPVKKFKKSKTSGISAKRKMRNRENFECKNCGKQFCTKTLFWNHINVCTRRNSVNKNSNNSSGTSILEAHLKNNNQIKKEDPEPISNESNLNIPDFNLFEDINLQLSGQKPVPDLMPISSMKGGSSSKCLRKDSRKVYDESTNTECACEVCGKQWPAKKHLWQHLIRFHRAEAAVTCGVCLKLCQTYEDLATHLKVAHEAILTGEGNNFTCKTCGRYHNARSKLLLHMSIHINYNGSQWCPNCHEGFEDEEKLKEHLKTCTEKCIEFYENSNDMDASVKNDDNQDKGSLIDDDNSLMEEVEEVEFESEVEGEATENHDNSNSDNTDSEASDSSTSDAEENDEDIEEEDDEENGIDHESRTHSRMTGDVSSDSQSEAENSDHAAEDITAHGGNDPNDKETINVPLSGSDDTNMENETQKDDKSPMEETDTNVSDLLKIDTGKTEDAPSGGLKIKSEIVNEIEFDEEPCELQNQALFKEEPGDYTDDEGPPILSPMVPLAMANSTEDHDVNDSEKTQYKRSPTTLESVKTEKPTVLCELDQIRNEIEKGEPSWSASDLVELNNDSNVKKFVITANNLTGILESDSDIENEEDRDSQGGDDASEIAEEAFENDENSEFEEITPEKDETDNDHQEEDIAESCDEQVEDNLGDTQNEVDMADDTSDKNTDEEIEDMDVGDNADTVQIPSLDGTVIMVANDADGNQILIQRNVSDFPNEDSNPEVTEYILEEENEYEMSNYEVASNEDATQQSDDSPVISDEENENDIEVAEEEQISISAKSNVSRT